MILGHRTESHTSMRNLAGQFIDVFMFGESELSAVNDS